MRRKPKPKPKAKGLKVLKRIFILTFIASTIRIVYLQNIIYSQEKEVEREIMQLIEIELKKQEELNYELEYNLSDEYIERIARDQWGYLKSHEIIFRNTNN